MIIPKISDEENVLSDINTEKINAEIAAEKYETKLLFFSPKKSAVLRMMPLKLKAISRRIN